jgi:hypothetical protein
MVHRSLLQLFHHHYCTLIPHCSMRVLTLKPEAQKDPKESTFVYILIFKFTFVKLTNSLSFSLILSGSFFASASTFFIISFC